MTLFITAQREVSQLVMIDMQEKLANAMDKSEMSRVSKNCEILLQAARLLTIPTIVTEQYPKGLGHTTKYLVQHLQHTTCIEKTSFSCCEESTFNQKLTNDRRQLILVGMESHICILQTALALRKMGKEVFVVEDATISRDPNNKSNALKRLAHSGIIISNTESVLFEWLGNAEGENFKQISKLIR